MRPATGLRFTRNGSSYTLSKIDGNFRANLGGRVTLTDDDSASVAIPFAFPFYGAGQTAAFVNSDGNITLGEPDSASTDRSLARMLTGAPRVSPFFADLDPTTGTGKVFPNSPDENFSQKVNRKMYRAGVASILSQLAREGRIAVVEDFAVEAPKTRLLAQKLKGMGLESVLVITHEMDENLFLSSRNLRDVLVLEVQEADPVSLVRFPQVVVTRGALAKMEEAWQ